MSSVPSSSRTSLHGPYLLLQILRFNVLVPMCVACLLYIAMCPSIEEHDVFLSFRGEDTRNNFVSHLRSALLQNSIKPFIDDELRRGEMIAPALFNAIERSKIAIVIVSKNYAASPWCLEELVKIIECHAHRKTAIPIFYYIRPSDVMYQRGVFAQAFETHDQNLTQPDKVKRWRKALNESAKIAGWVSQNIKPEARLIKQVVKEICRQLQQMSAKCQTRRQCLPYFLLPLLIIVSMAMAWHFINYHELEKAKKGEPKNNRRPKVQKDPVSYINRLCLTVGSFLGSLLVLILSNEMLTQSLMGGEIIRKTQCMPLSGSSPIG